MKRILGKDLQVEAVGYGCMGLSHASGAPTEKSEAIKIVRQAVEAGYTLFDTAECYKGINPDGSIHYNEEIVGEALAPYRKDVVIATKCGVEHTATGLKMDSRPETIRGSVEGSLKKLKVDYIDLYYQHRVDPNVSPEEVAGVMADLIKEGKITHWGASEVAEEYIRRAHAVCPMTAIQNRLSMMFRGYETLFPVLEELNIGYVAFSPLANGFLSARYDGTAAFEAGTDYRSKMPQFTKEALKANETLLTLLQQTAEAKNATPAQISMAWMINKKPYIVPIPGTRKLDRIKENFGAGSIVLTKDEVLNIDTALENMEMSDVFSGSKNTK